MLIMEKFKINKNYLKFLCPETMNLVFTYIFSNLPIMCVHIYHLNNF